ncbi:MAG: DUF4430 domain-containing protein [Lachnospiraceae bacterium]
MKMNFRKKTMSFFLCMMLIVAMAFGAIGCNGKTGQETVPTTETAVAVQTETGSEETVSAEETATSRSSTEALDVQLLGEGNTIFTLLVVDGEGKETLFEIHTDKKTVGEALVELELVEGEVGEFGLYVKTVNKITADYDKDGTYWAFYIDGEYAQTGIDQTEIKEGSSYSLRVE